MQNNGKKFELPIQLLNQLDECSNGGLVLFRFNQDDDIEHHIVADDHSKAVSLMSYIRLFLEAQDEISKDIIKMDHFYASEEEDGDYDSSDDINF